jgi:hypothetical protein
VCVVGGGGGCLVWFMKVAGNLADWRYCLELQQPIRCNRCIAVEREFVEHMSCVWGGAFCKKTHSGKCIRFQSLWLRPRGTLWTVVDLRWARGVCVANALYHAPSAYPAAPVAVVCTGLQYLLPATWTAVKSVGVDLLQLSHVLSTNPARLAGLHYKGHLAPNMDADIVVSWHR